MNGPRSIELRIDWSEIDAFKHVNNVMYFKYAQAARVALCDSVEIATVADDKKPGFMVAHVSCDFIAPLDFPGTIKVISEVESVGNTSFKLVHRMQDGQGQTVAIAKDVLVYFDFDRNEKVTIGSELRQRLMAFQS